MGMGMGISIGIGIAPSRRSDYIFDFKCFFLDRPCRQ